MKELEDVDWDKIEHREMELDDARQEDRETIAALEAQLALLDKTVKLWEKFVALMPADEQKAYEEQKRAYNKEVHI